MLSNNPGKKINEFVESYIVFDLETTGVSSRKDEIIEISAIKVIDGKVAGEFSYLVNPLIHIPERASMVNGITDDMVSDAPTIEPVLMEFIDFIEDYPLVGHNIANFDMKFIYRYMRNLYGKVMDNDFIDTLPLSRQVLPQLTSYKLVSLAQYYDISTIGAHRALNDCAMNQMVYERLRSESSKSSCGQQKGQKLCPICDRAMKLRSGHYGQFWGCSGYPGCTYTENI